MVFGINYPVFQTLKAEEITHRIAAGHTGLAEQRY